MRSSEALLDMATKKKPVGRPKTAKPVRSLASVKGTDSREEWLDGLVRHVKLQTRTSMIWQAIEEYAERRGYKPSLPEK